MLTRPGTMDVLMAVTVGLVPRMVVPHGDGIRRLLTEQPRFVICLFSSVRSNFFVVVGEVKWRGYEGLCEVKGEVKFQTQG